MVQDLEDGKSNTKVCKSYNLSSSTVSPIWKNHDSIIKSFDQITGSIKKRRICKNPERDKARYKRLVIRKNENVPICGPFLTLSSFCKTNDLKDDNFQLQHKYKQPSILDFFKR